MYNKYIHFIYLYMRECDFIIFNTVLCDLILCYINSAKINL